MTPDPKRFATGVGLVLLVVGFLGTKLIVDNVPRASRNMAAIAFVGALYAIYVLALWGTSRKIRRGDVAASPAAASARDPHETRRERRLLWFLTIPILVVVLCTLVEDEKAMMIAGGFLLLPAMIAAYMLAYRDGEQR